MRSVLPRTANSMLDATATKAHHPVHQLLSRTGSFPLPVAAALIRRFTPTPGYVLDPFCGKGTTALAARLLGHATLASDIAPEAVACTRAKMSSVTLESLVGYLATVNLGEEPTEDVPADVKVYFHPRTLDQLLRVRSRLLKDLKNVNTAENANFALCLLLGILHGHASYSLSISSSHAFAMSPRYVRRYAERMNLEPPVRDVRRCLLEKANRCLQTPLPPPVPFEVARCRAQEMVDVFNRHRGQVSLILTSPPYLDKQTYAKDNWLRLWLLGFDWRQLKDQYLQTASHKRYLGEMRPTLERFVDLLRPGGRLVLVTGIVSVNGASSPRQSLQLLDLLRPAIPSTLRLIASEEHRVPSSVRYLNALAKTNGHSSRELREQVLVAEKV